MKGPKKVGQKTFENHVSFTQQSAAPLADIREKLEKQDNPMSAYWQVYALLYEAIYYMKTGQR